MADRTPPARDGTSSLATGTALFLIAQQVASKATRDTLFLSNFSADELPKAMAAAAVLSLAAVFAASRLYAAYGPNRVVPALMLASAALFGAEWWALPWAPKPTSAAIYLHVAVFGALGVSGFWSVVNERYDPHAAKAAVARIGGGATLGGMIGGFAAERVTAFTDVRTLLVGLLLLNAICAFGVGRLGRGMPAAEPSDAGRHARGGLEVLRGNAYLRSLAVLVLLTSLGGALLDFSLKAHAAATYGSDRGLMTFFAVFYSAMSVGTFVLQTLASKSSLERVGLAGTVAILPGAVVVLGVAAGLIAKIVPVAIARGAQYVVENSLYRSGYELLYTPVAPRDKRPTKTLIDVGFDRIGDAAGSAVILGLLVVVPNTSPAIVFASVVVAVGALWFSLRLNRGYVEQLATSLRDGSLELSESEVVDATTRRTLTETTMALDRERLLAQIREFRASQSAPSGAVVDSARPPASDEPATDGGPEPPIVDALRGLMSPEPERLRETLRSDLDPRLVAFVIPALGRADVGKDALDALRRLAPRVQGQLVDALLDPNQPFAVRRRLPRVLRGASGARIAQGLLAGLGDARFEVRYQCGRALAELTAREPDLHVPAERVYEVVHREIDVGRTVWQGQRLLDAPEDEGLFGPLVRDRVDRSLEHVFTLMGLVLDRDTLALCFKALSSKDRNLRGTALEYLENVLPAPIRERLWPHLEADVKREAPASERKREQIVDDLLRSMEGVPLDRRALGED